MKYQAVETDGMVRLGTAEHAAMHAHLCALAEGNAAFVDRCFQLFIEETVADLAHLDAGLRHNRRSHLLSPPVIWTFAGPFGAKPTREKSNKKVAY